MTGLPRWVHRSEYGHPPTPHQPEGHPMTDYHPYPPPPPPAPAAGEGPSSGMATAALILGILGVLGGLIPFLFLPVLCLGVLGFVLGLIARGRRKRARASTGMATWGVVLSVLAIALGVFGMVTVFGAVDELDRDLEQLEQDMEDDMSDLTTPEGD